METRVSGSWALNLRERIKALVLSVLAVIVSAVVTIIQNEGTIPMTLEEYKPIIAKGLSFGLLYVLVTFTSNGHQPSALENLIKVKKDNNLS